MCSLAPEDAVELVSWHMALFLKGQEKLHSSTTLIHTLNCAFLWLYRVSKIALTTQMDSKTIRGKWWPVLSELLVSEDDFTRMIRATWAVPGILRRWLSLKRKIARLWFLPALAEGPMVMFVCFTHSLGIESRALPMLGKYSATKLYFPPHFLCCRLRQILTQLPRWVLNWLCPTQALNLWSSCSRLPNHWELSLASLALRHLGNDYRLHCWKPLWWTRSWEIRFEPGIFPLSTVGFV